MAYDSEQTGRESAVSQGGPGVGHMQVERRNHGLLASAQYIYKEL